MAVNLCTMPTHTTSGKSPCLCLELTSQLKFPKIQIIYIYIYIKREPRAIHEASIAATASPASAVTPTELYTSGFQLTPLSKTKRETTPKEQQQQQKSQKKTKFCY